MTWHDLFVHVFVFKRSNHVNMLNDNRNNIPLQNPFFFFYKHHIQKHLNKWLLNIKIQDFISKSWKYVYNLTIRVSIPKETRVQDNTSKWSSKFLLAGVMWFVEMKRSWNEQHINFFNVLRQNMPMKIC
jgi:hypothetical protein